MFMSHPYKFCSPNIMGPWACVLQPHGPKPQTSLGAEYVG